MTNTRACVHWTGSRCRLGLYGGTPSAGICRQCPVRLGGSDDGRAFQDRLASGESGRLKAARPRKKCGCCGKMQIGPWGVVDLDQSFRWSRFGIAPSIGERRDRRR
jgi:hypothetical protein